MATHKLLFSGVDWHSVDQQQRARLAAEIEQIDGDRLLNTSVDDLCAYVENKYRIDVPAIREDDIVVEQSETKQSLNDYGRQVQVTGTAIDFTVPFDGDEQVFNIRPSTFSLNPPRVMHVQNGALVVRISGPNLETNQVRAEFDRTLAEIQRNLGTLQTNTQTFNSQLSALARQAIERRRDKLLRDRKLAASLGFKMKERADAARTYVAPDVRRKIAPTLPPASTKPYVPEPTLSDADYDHILGVVENMAHVMERSPSAFESMDEESLRSHFLVQLNGHYEGQATGETFNYQGKTDILIRSEGRNIFIAECKFWAGPKKLTETLDQLLSYSSWRDTKVAVIVFNRNKDFTNVLRSIQDAAKTHPNRKRELGARSETSFRYVFAHRDDPNRELILTVLAFDVPG